MLKESKRRLVVDPKGKNRNQIMQLEFFSTSLRLHRVLPNSSSSFQNAPSVGGARGEFLVVCGVNNVVRNHVPKSTSQTEYSMSMQGLGRVGRVMAATRECVGETLRVAPVAVHVLVLWRCSLVRRRHDVIMSHVRR
jgi:hypothetical protein